MPFKVKDFMIPIEEYVSIDEEATLLDYFQALEKNKAEKGLKHSHRDVIVLKDGELIGKVTIADVYMALEPAYKSILDLNGETSVLTASYMANLFKQYDMWSSTLEDMCKRGAGKKIKDFMHAPEEAEFIEADSKLGAAMHAYVMGVHQPLLVREEGKVIGILRYADVFEKIRELTLTCSL